MWITLVALHIGALRGGATATCSRMHGLHVHLVCCVGAGRGGGLCGLMEAGPILRSFKAVWLVNVPQAAEFA